MLQNKILNINFYYNLKTFKKYFNLLIKINA